MNEALSAQPAPLASGEGMDKVREALAVLEDAINAEGFGCACMPDVKCATCKARDLMSKWVRPSFEKLREALSAQPAESVALHHTESAWLIEWRAHGFGPQWWGFNYEPGRYGMWCSDANNAIRFSRREDAERMRLHVIAARDLTGQHTYEQQVTVSKHEWSLSAQPAPSVPAVPEFCCEHAWSAAKQLAWKERDLSCDCDHNEYCQKCFPLEFRAGGKWDKYAAAPHQATKGEPT